MKKKFFVFFLISHFFAFAGNEDYGVGARSSAMGGAAVSMSDAWSAHNNQAGLGFLHDVSGGVYYENRFMLKQLSIRGGVAAIPVRGGTFGLCITNFGYSAYSENKYSLSFAKAFGDKLSAGIAMDYLSTRIAEGYGQSGAFAAEFGIQAKPIKGLTLGAHVYNPTRAKIADYNDERLPTIIRLGGDYAFSEKVSVAVETEKDIAKKAQFKAGIEYRPVKEFYLRAGVGTNPTLTCFGFGINLGSFKIDIAANYHQTLGISPQLGLTYVLHKTGTKSGDPESVH
jgi:hypothetical protein